MKKVFFLFAFTAMAAFVNAQINPLSSQIQPDAVTTPYVPPIDLNTMAQVNQYKEQRYEQNFNWVKQTISQLYDLLNNRLYGEDVNSYNQIKRNLDNYVNMLNSNSIDYGNGDIINQISNSLNSIGASINNAINNASNSSGNNADTAIQQQENIQNNSSGNSASTVNQQQYNTQNLSQNLAAEEMIEKAMDASRKGNYADAVQWYQKAAEQGSSIAQERLGFMYYNGYGVTKDITQAIYWYKKAAAQDDAIAINALKGLGVSYP